MLTGAVLALSILVVINAVLDLMGLGKTTKLYMLVANIIRYVLQLILVVLFVAFTFIVKSASLGFFGYVLAVVALLQFIINLVRLLIFSSKKKKAARQKSKTTATVVVAGDAVAENAGEAEAKRDRKAEKRAAKEAKKAEKVAAKAAKNQPVEETAAEETETAAAEAAPIVQKNDDPTVYVVEPTY